LRFGNISVDLRPVYIKTSFRPNPTTGRLSAYYRLVESYRNEEDRVCHRTLLNIGFWEDTTDEQQDKIVLHLNNRYKNQTEMFEETDQFVIENVELFWNKMIKNKTIDRKKMEVQHKMVNIDTIKHKEVREIGAEWICVNTWNELRLTELLESLGWSEEKIKLAMTQVVSRAVYPASELATTRWIKENSAICDLTGYDIKKVTKDKLYKGALDLYGVKDKIVKHLSKRTNELFDLQDKIILYDLTNTYFEGEKRNSQLAKFGRSKEKRSDAKIVVLAMVVNQEGFIKYSCVHEGNYADTNDITKVIENLAINTSYEKPVVVMDAGIATKDNLKRLETKGYKYVVVSRVKIKDYKMATDGMVTYHQTKSMKHIRLTKVKSEKYNDYFLKVESLDKHKKEAGIKDQFEKRFEEMLEKIKVSLTKPRGIKTIDKVNENIGKAKAKYPSAHKQYTITIITDEKEKKVTSIEWEKNKKDDQKENELGVYFIRTNLQQEDETILWMIYNTIREIESTFRALKTDLDLRPIYHKNDNATIAHLHLAIMAYWLVNTIRHKLKSNKINSCWQEIVRIANTQKKVETIAQNTYDKTIHVKKCSEPSEQLLKILNALKFKLKPFKKLNVVVHKPPTEKMLSLYPSNSPPI
jgi:transposase